MAGDWIKMRVWLSKDPKVISMADRLSGDRAFMNWLTDPVQRTCTNSAYEHVTRNVTVALCVTGLLVTWGSAREQGDRENDDLVVSHCRIYTIDAMTDVPGFGAAMASVGWAVERDDEVLVFPNFFKDNESPDYRHKRQNAERQARHRKKQSRSSDVTDNVTDNVTVTHREEKRRVSKPIVLNAGFILFWNVYPKRVAKPSAERAWLKINPSEELTARILAAVKKSSRSPDWQKDGGQFIPNPATYLNQKRWEDETPTALPQGPLL